MEINKVLIKAIKATGFKQVSTKGSAKTCDYIFKCPTTNRFYKSFTSGYVQCYSLMPADYKPTMYANTFRTHNINPSNTKYRKNRNSDGFMQGNRNEIPSVILLMTDTERLTRILDLALNRVKTIEAEFKMPVYVSQVNFVSFE